MTKKKRIASFCLVLAMVFAMAFSAFFIAHNSEHNCSGNDCHICEQIGICIRSLNNITPKPETASLCETLAFAVVLVIGFALSEINKKSLIDLKVKLSS